jgi:ferrous iron transport protein A
MLTIFAAEQLANANYFNPNQVIHMNLSVAEEGKEYIIQRIETDDEELDAFLFSLGCYAGEPITVVSRRRGGCTVSIKDGRYNIDNQLAEAIIIYK